MYSGHTKQQSHNSQSQQQFVYDNHNHNNAPTQHPLVAYGIPPLPNPLIPSATGYCNNDTHGNSLPYGYALPHVYPYQCI